MACIQALPYILQLHSLSWFIHMKQGSGWRQAYMYRAGSKRLRFRTEGMRLASQSPKRSNLVARTVATTQESSHCSNRMMTYDVSPALPLTTANVKVDEHGEHTSCAALFVPCCQQDTTLCSSVPGGTQHSWRAVAQRTRRRYGGACAHAAEFGERHTPRAPPTANQVQRTFRDERGALMQVSSDVVNSTKFYDRDGPPAVLFSRVQVREPHLPPNTAWRRFLPNVAAR